MIKFVSDNSFVPDDSHRTAVALGFFDSLHIGHIRLIENVVEAAGRLNLTPLLQTFENFDIKGKQIFNFEQRRKICRKYGLSNFAILNFDEELRSMAPEKFIDDILIDKLKVSYVCVGEDYRFGSNRLGDSKFLFEKLKVHGVKCVVIPDVNVNEQTKLSTSYIKKLLDEGHVEEANSFLSGDGFFYEGKIIHGQQIGRTIGIRTINIKIEDDCLAVRRGVYFSKTIIDGNEYFSISNVGIKPTIDEKNRILMIETNIFDFNANVYDKIASVYLLEWIRDEQKFEDVFTLKSQIESDIMKGQNLIKKYSGVHNE